MENNVISVTANLPSEKKILETPKKKHALSLFRSRQTSRIICCL